MHAQIEAGMVLSASWPFAALCAAASLGLPFRTCGPGSTRSALLSLAMLSQPSGLRTGTRRGDGDSDQGVRQVWNGHRPGEHLKNDLRDRSAGAVRRADRL